MKIVQRYAVGAALTAERVREWIELSCIERGDQARFAEKAGVSPAFVNDILRGNREPSGKVLDAMGLERQVRYRVVRGPK